MTHGDVVRPDWNTYFLSLAKTVATRADCRRAQHGAVIVKNCRVISTGYNGSPAGMASCLKGKCPRGLLTTEQLAHNSADYTNCLALHAEQNAIAYASRSGTEGASIYITGRPCDNCLKLIIAAGIEHIYTPEATWYARNLLEEQLRTAT